MHSFVIHRFSLASQQYRQAPIAKSRLLPRQLHQTQAQPFIAPPALITVTRYRHRQQAAGSPLADGVVAQASACELSPFAFDFDFDFRYCFHFSFCLNFLCPQPSTLPRILLF